MTCPEAEDAFPYAIGIAADHSVWYSSYYLDVIGRLIRRPGKLSSIRFRIRRILFGNSFPMGTGRMWYGSPSNNKVGYFYLTGASERAGK